MSGYVTVHLTRAQAKALLAAAGNSLCDGEDAKAILGRPASVQAGYRAMEKLRDALHNPRGERDA